MEYLENLSYINLDNNKISSFEGLLKLG